MRVRRRYRSSASSCFGSWMSSWYNRCVCFMYMTHCIWDLSVLKGRGCRLRSVLVREGVCDMYMTHCICDIQMTKGRPHKLSSVLVREGTHCISRTTTDRVICTWHIAFVICRWLKADRRTPSWIPSGVEPGNQEGPGCWDLRRVLVRIQKTPFVRYNGTNQTKEGSRGRNPASKKLLVWGRQLRPMLVRGWVCDIHIAFVICKQPFRK